MKTVNLNQQVSHTKHGTGIITEIYKYAFKVEFDNGSEHIYNKNTKVVK